MLADEIIVKYVGGATAYFEAGGLRFLTDPTFDAKGTTYETSIYVLQKTADPAIQLSKIGHIDFVLLSHDHHFDNLDNSGRDFLSTVKSVYTTSAGADRLGKNAVGLENWASVEIPTKDGRILTVTGTPCRHGPVNGDRGPVTGFLLQFKNEAQGAVYISGDTVFYEGVKEVANRFNVAMAILFMGAAVVKEVGEDHLTMTIEESILVAKLFKEAAIIPLHYEGWRHFTENKTDIEFKFKEAGLYHRLKWAESYE